MHNGRIPDFHKIKRKLRHVLKDEFYDMIQGTTDSEHAFALFLNYLSEFDDPGVEDYRSCLRATIHQLNTWTEEAGIEEPSAFNFAFTDGSQVVVTRYSSNPDIAAPESLYTAQICHYHCDQQDGNVHLDHGPTEAVIIASEPLTPLKHEWQAVETNSLLTISADVRLESEPL
jgi:predicted glutamine amidotransferase